MSRRFFTLACAVALLAILPVAAFAQVGPDLTPLYNEFGVLFEEIGNDSISHIQQFGLIMDGTGRAEIGPHVFVAWSGGAVFLPGVLTFRSGENPFSIFDISQIVSDMLEPGTVADIYNSSAEFFLNPGMRLTLGAGLKNGLEFYAHFGIIPQAITTAAEGIISNFVDLRGLVFNRFNAGVRIRKVLLSDQGPFPAISLGVGYTLTQFNLGLTDLAALPLGESFELSGFGLGLGGSLNIGTSMHTGGVELVVSKRLLFFAPFVKVAGYYQWTRYSGGIEDLVVTMSSDALPTDIVATGTDPKSEQSVSDLSFVGSAGFELVFGKLSLIALGSYDVGSATPAANLSIQFRF